MFVKISPHAAQPYESLFDAARCAFAFFAPPFFPLDLVAFFAGCALADFSAFGFASRRAASVPWMLQKRQPCRT